MRLCMMRVFDFSFNVGRKARRRRRSTDGSAQQSSRQACVAPNSVFAVQVDNGGAADRLRDGWRDDGR